MKNLFKLSSLLLAGLFMLTSCEPKNDDVEVASLQLSKNTLNFDKLGGEESVAITTNQTNWTYVSNLEGQWVNITKDGNNLKITALPNPEGKDRSGVILVTAGGASSRIEVAQIAADIVLDINPGELSFSAKGGEKRISVKSNSNAWEIAPVEEVDWLKFEKAGDIVFVTALPNQGDPRETKLLAKSGTKQAEVVVKQAAVEKYALPLYQLTSAADIVRQEVARGAILKSFTEPSEFWGTQVDGAASFFPSSSLFTDFTYSFGIDAPDTWKQIVCLSNDWKELSGEGFKAFLKEKGFAPVEGAQTEKKMIYNNEDGTIEVTILQEGEGTQAVQGMIFKRIIKQTKEYATFSSLPKPLHPFLDKQKVAAVEKWAADNGYKVDQKAASEVNKDQTEFISFIKDAPKGDEADAILCFFYCDTKEGKVDPTKEGQLQQYHVIYKTDLNRMMWNATGNLWKVTKEYDALIKAGGYPDLYGANEAKNNYFYVNGNNIALVNKARFSDLFDGADIVRTGYWWEDLGEDSSSYSVFAPTKKSAIREKAENPFKYLKK